MADDPGGVSEAVILPDQRLTVALVARWPIGGIRTYLRYVLGDSAFQRFDYVMIAPRPPADGVDNLRAALAGLNVRYAFCQPTLSSFAWTVSKELATSSVRLVHSHGFTASAVASLPARVMRVPHLATTHEVLTAPQFSGRWGGVKRWLLERALDQADVIQTVSFDAAQNLREFLPGIRRARVVTVPSGIEVSRFLGAVRRDLRHELGLPSEAFLVGFLGRFMSPKGFRYLIDAIGQLVVDPTFRRPVVVVAVGSGGFVREDRALIRERGLQESFKFLPFVDDVGSTLRGIDVLAVPSVWEACGLVAMEAMVSGTPVIGTDCIGLREVLSDTPSTVVPARNGSLLANALRLHAEDPSFKVKAKAFEKEAAARFTVKRTSSGVAQLYEAVLSGRRRVERH